MKIKFSLIIIFFIIIIFPKSSNATITVTANAEGTKTINVTCTDVSESTTNLGITGWGQITGKNLESSTVNVLTCPTTATFLIDYNNIYQGINFPNEREIIILRSNTMLPKYYQAETTDPYSLTSPFIQPTPLLKAGVLPETLYPLNYLQQILGKQINITNCQNFTPLITDNIAPYYQNPTTNAQEFQWASSSCQTILSPLDIASTTPIDNTQRNIAIGIFFLFISMWFIIYIFK